MALPKLQHTMYTHFLIGAQKEIKFRPFTNHEQKTLLLAKDQKDKDAIISAINEIISGCTNGKVNGDDLCTFDVEDLFVRIRSKSVGEELTLKYRHDYTDDEGKPKSNFIDVNIKIDDIKVHVDPSHTKKIMLSDDIGIVMKYPTFGMLKTVNTNEDIAIGCIDYIFDKDEVYPANQASNEELKSFYDDIDTKGLMQIKNFFDTMPKLRHEVEVKLKDGTVETVVYEGLEDFFQ